MTESNPSNPSPSKISEAKDRKDEADGAYCTLTRIDDDAYLKLVKYSYPIFPQFIYWRFRSDPKEERLNFAQYYAGMRRFFGKPGNLYDDYKGAFSFCFRADVFRQGKSYPYVLNIIHYRNGVEFGFRKIISTTEVSNISDMETYHRPFDDELSSIEMKSIQVYVYGFLQGYLSIVQKTPELNVPDFVLLTESNYIISGHINGEFFEHHIESYDDFQAHLKKIQHLIEKPVESWPDDGKAPKSLTIKLECKEPANVIVQGNSN